MYCKLDTHQDSQVPVNYLINDPSRKKKSSLNETYWRCEVKFIRRKPFIFGVVKISKHIF